MGGGERLLALSLSKVSGVLRPQSEKRGSLKPLVGLDGGVGGRSRTSFEIQDEADEADDEGEIAGLDSDEVEGKRIRGRAGGALDVGVGGVWLYCTSPRCGEEQDAERMLWLD